MGKVISNRIRWLRFENGEMTQRELARPAVFARPGEQRVAHLVGRDLHVLLFQSIDQPPQRPAAL